MTGLEILTASWEQTGKPSTLDPTNSTALVTLVRAFNYEAPTVVNWKRGARQLRLRWYETTEYHKYTTYTGTVASLDSTETVITLDDVTGFPDVLSEALVVDSNDEVRYVYAYNASTPSISINEAFTTAPVATDTLTIYPVQFALTTDRFIEVMRVELTNSQIELTREPLQDSRLGNITTFGTPSTYERVGKYIWLNTAPDESDTLIKVTYQRLPNLWVTAVDATGANIDIPHAYHGAMVYRFIWWFYLQQQETEKAQNAWNNFNNYMNTVMSPDDFVQTMENGRPSIVRAV